MQTWLIILFLGMYIIISIQSRKESFTSVREYQKAAAYTLGREYNIDGFLDGMEGIIQHNSMNCERNDNGDFSCNTDSNGTTVKLSSSSSDPNKYYIWIDEDANANYQCDKDMKCNINITSALEQNPVHEFEFISSETDSPSFYHIKNSEGKYLNIDKNTNHLGTEAATAPTEDKYKFSFDFPELIRTHPPSPINID